MSEKREKAEDLGKIKEWLEKQPHLPQKVDNQLLLRFLHCCDFSLEKTKQLIDLFFTVRWQAPEIFADRDPTDPALIQALETFQMVPLPVTTDEQYQLLFYRLADHNPDNFNYVNTIKVLFMLADVRLISQSEIPKGEVPIFEMEGISLRHLTKINLPVMKKYMFYSQEAHPIKLRQIHCLNIPSFMDRLMALSRPFLNSDVAKMINFHQTGSNTLTDFIKQDLLPDEFGGKAGSCKELNKAWVKKIMDHRDYFMDESRWKVDESKRPVDSSNGKQLFGMQGSFRSLSID